MWINLEDTWGEHWNKLLGKITGYLGIVQNSCYSATAATAIYNKIIIPIINYTCQAIEPHLKTLRKIQGKAAHIIYQKMRVTGYENAFWRLQTPTAEGGLGQQNIIAQAQSTHINSLIQQFNKNINSDIVKRKIDNYMQHLQLELPLIQVQENEETHSIAPFIFDKNIRTVLKAQKVRFDDVFDETHALKSELRIKGVQEQQLRKEITRSMCENGKIKQQILLMEDRHTSIVSWQN